MSARPLVGRSAERAELDAALKNAERTGLQVVLVHGPAGIGKSHLVRDFIEGLPRDLLTITIGCKRDVTSAGDAAQRLATRLLGDPDAAALPWFQDDALTGGPIDSGGASASRRHRTIARALSAALVDRRAALLVEDAQWSDDVSREILSMWLEELLDDAPRYPVVVIVTLRTDGAAVSDSLAGGIRQSHRCAELTLEPLDPLHEYQLIRQELGRAVSPALADEVHRRARGVPLDVRAAVALLRREATDADASQVSQPDGASRWITLLDDHTRAVLAIAAIVDDELDAERLAAVSSFDGEAIVRAIGDGERAGVLERDHGSIRFAHERVRAALGLLLPPEQRRHLHARLVADRHASELERAEHCLAAGDELPRDLRTRVLADGGLACATRGAWADAARYYEAALAAARGSGLHDTVLAELRFAAGYAHFCNQDVQRSELRLRELTDLTLAPELEALRVDGELALYRLKITSTRDALRAANDDRFIRDIAQNDPDGSRRAVALGLLSEASSMAGDTSEALTRAERAIEEAERHGGNRERGRAWFALGLAAASSLDDHRAIDAYRRARRFADAAQDALFVGGVDTRLPFVVLQRFDLDLASETSAMGLERARNDANYANQAFALAIQSSVAFARGDLDRAVVAAREALHAAERAAYPAAHLPAVIPAILALGMAGRTDEAQELLGASATVAGIGAFLPALARHAGHPVADVMRAPTRFDGPVGVGRLLAAADHAIVQTDAALLHQLVPHLRSHYERGTWSSPYWPVYLPRVLGVAAWAIGETDEASHVLRTAAASANRCRAATDRALAELALAHLLRASGHVDEAVQRASVAFDIADQLGFPAVRREAAALMRSHGAQPALASSPAEGWRVVAMFDLVDSTALSMRRGDREYFRVVTRFRTEVARAVGAWHGEIVDTAGDGVLAWFVSPSDAESCAWAVLDAIALAREDGLDARIGLAAGRPYVADGRPIGSVVNLAARLCAVAGPAGVMVNEELATWSQRPGSYSSGGTIALKGVPGEVTVMRLRT